MDEYLNHPSMLSAISLSYSARHCFHYFKSFYFTHDILCHYNLIVEWLNGHTLFIRNEHPWVVLIRKKNRKREIWKSIVEAS